jgi:hypothetical protein
MPRRWRPLAAIPWNECACCLFAQPSESKAVVHTCSYFVVARDIERSRSDVEILKFGTPILGKCIFEASPPARSHRQYAKTSYLSDAEFSASVSFSRACRSDHGRTHGLRHSIERHNTLAIRRLKSYRNDGQNLIALSLPWSTTGRRASQRKLPCIYVMVDQQKSRDVGERHRCKHPIF